ncbi:MAG: family 43 glycosylhydrolase [Bacteroidales bacterium]|nr:family 43 glycosylhydrolase [Bacteroidales bacterium]
MSLFSFPSRLPLLLSAFLALACSPDIDPSRVVANPIDVDYAFTHHHQEGGREAADPVMAFFNGHYYLFPSMTYGYWSSEDMQHWHFITNEMMPFGDYAPAVMVFKGELYWTVSFNNKLYKTADPEDGDSWKLVSDSFHAYIDNPDKTIVDPYLFPDEDGRVYLYWGCSQVEPIQGVELDPQKNFSPKTQPIALIEHNQSVYGWECRGPNNDTEEPSSNEGSAMIKHDGRYYLQYAGPGTEWPIYGDGVYVGDSPLGPFSHCAESPFSIKPGGWMTGAGHGDTFRDAYGNFWHTSSTVISKRFLFERRIGFFPAFFNEAGELHVRTDCSDWPYVLPDKKVDFEKESIWTGWMDLTIGKNATASSSLADHSPELGADSDISTWWSASSGNPGEWFCVDLGKVCRLNAVQPNFADEGFGMFEAGKDKSPYRYIVEVSKNGKSWKRAFDRSKASDTRPHELLVLRRPVKARYVRLTSTDSLTGYMSLHDLRVFGLAHGKVPTKVSEMTLHRGEDRRRIEISWPASEGARGYFVRWGTRPDALYSSWQTKGTSLEAGLFSTDQEYWFRVDAFNDSGFAEGAVVFSTLK